MGKSVLPTSTKGRDNVPVKAWVSIKPSIRFFRKLGIPHNDTA